RIDKIAVFKSLSKEDLEKILDIELNAVQKRIFLTQTDRPFVLVCEQSAKDFLLAEGTDAKYGARHLKRSIEHHLVLPLSSLLATDQILPGDTVSVTLGENGELSFERANYSYRMAAAASGSFIESSVNL